MGVSQIRAVWSFSTADRVDEDRRRLIAIWIVVPRPVVRAKCRLERGKETDEECPFKVLVRGAEVRAQVKVDDAVGARHVVGDRVEEHPDWALMKVDAGTSKT